MANRKISQFPTIESVDIANADLLTLVHVFEVDPALRNKKITFSGFREYLDQYYINVGEDPSYNNVIISGNLEVSGNTSLNNLTVSGDSDFQAVIVGGNLTTSGSFSVTGTITGSQIEVDNVIADFLEISSGNFTIITGTTIDFVTGYFDTMSGATLTGESFGVVSGIIVDADINDLYAQVGQIDTLSVNNATFTGVFTQSGTINDNDINATGTISGATITGNVGQYTTLTGQTAVFTTQISGTSITGNSAYFERTTGTFIDVTNTLSGATITGDYGQFLNLTGYSSHATSFSGTTIVGDTATLATIHSTSGSFTYLSGVTVTGTSGLFTSVVTDTLTATDLQFSGDQTISGNFTVLEDIFISGSGYFASGITVTGEISGQTVTAQLVTAQSGTFNTIITAPTITGGTISGDNVYVSGTITGTTIDATSGHFVTATGTSAEFTTFSGASGVFTNVTGTSFSGTTVNAQTGVFTVFNRPGVFSEGITVTGDSNFVSGVVVGTNLTVTGTISGATVTGETATFTTGQFNDLYIDDIFIVGDNLTVSGDLNVSGEVYLQSGLTSRDQAFFPSGNQINPGIAIIDDPNTGIYSSSGDALEITTGSSRKLTISSGTYGAVLTIWGY